MVDHYHLILCRARDANLPDKINSTRRAFEERLLQVLPLGAARTTTVVPHLYDLAADSPVLERLSSFSGQLIVLSWLPDRATYWLLRKAGMVGTKAVLDADRPVGPESTNAGSDVARKIWCLDLNTYERPETCAESICRILSAAKPGVGATGTPADVEHVDEPTPWRWYPVIDYDRCANCLECLNFCLFGVFGLDASERIQVEQPGACRPGCPACARVCPSGAIMFPEHADPAISGDVAGPPGKASDGLSQLLPLLDPLRLATAERRAARTGEGEDTTARPPQATRQPTDADSHLDDLVDELDGLDL